MSRRLLQLTNKKRGTPAGLLCLVICAAFPDYRIRHARADPDPVIEVKAVDSSGKPRYSPCGGGWWSPVERASARCAYQMDQRAEARSTGALNAKLQRYPPRHIEPVQAIVPQRYTGDVSLLSAPRLIQGWFVITGCENEPK